MKGKSRTSEKYVLGKITIFSPTLISNKIRKFHRSMSSLYEWECFISITQKEKFMHKKITILVQNDTVMKKH